MRKVMGMRWTVVAVVWAVIAALFFIGCAPDRSGEFIDARDGKKYKPVRMPNRTTWMAENLNHQTPSGSRCYADNESYCDRYGRLYNWETATTACPYGWHLPSKYEWDDLIETINWNSPYGWHLPFISYEVDDAYKWDDLMEILSGTSWNTSGYLLKAKDAWDDDWRLRNGNDLYGFAALPGGVYCDHTTNTKPLRSPVPVINKYCEYKKRDGVFHDAGVAGNWWTEDEYGFSALPGGYRYLEEVSENYPYDRNERYVNKFYIVIYPFFYYYKRVAFSGLNRDGKWWTATEGAYGSAFSRYIRVDRDYIAEFNDAKYKGFSVRCVMDD